MSDGILVIKFFWSYHARAERYSVLQQCYSFCVYFLLLYSLLFPGSRKPSPMTLSMYALTQNPDVRSHFLQMFLASVISMTASRSTSSNSMTNRLLDPSASMMRLLAVFSQNGWKRSTISWALRRRRSYLFAFLVSIAPEPTILIEQIQYFNALSS
jgi:hypothetical protein